MGDTLWDREKGRCAPCRAELRCHGMELPFVREGYYAEHLGDVVPHGLLDHGLERLRGLRAADAGALQLHGRVRCRATPRTITFARHVAPERWLQRTV